MITVDIPMYFNRFVNMPASELRSLADILELNRCKKVSADYSVWSEEMPWMTGYFTVGVWVALWLAQADIHMSTKY